MVYCRAGAHCPFLGTMLYAQPVCSLGLHIGFCSCETVCLFRRTGLLWFSKLARQANEIWQRLYDPPELGT